MELDVYAISNTESIRNICITLPNTAVCPESDSGGGGNGGGEVTAGVVNQLLLSSPRPRLAGWWGHRREDRFLMASQFIPCKGANGFRLSNPPVLLIACARASLDLFDKVSYYLEFAFFSKSPCILCGGGGAGGYGISSQ